ncbi:hypothetical protein CC78DRAFT_582463 [Lojkania enalia]|uniref:PLAC8 family protein n=1 Tax=Lojkania enalia TaxID=147567 RepID=A0A9P4K645_9PLEO|nr:hypothetical protein CC78DRAFT_582463 [Didymosphaeria enalia]
MSSSPAPNSPAATLMATNPKLDASNHRPEGLVGELKKPTIETGEEEWRYALCDCFEDMRICRQVCYCPCFTFGKLAWRVQHDGDMEGYESCNQSVIPSPRSLSFFIKVLCILYYLACNSRVHWALLAMQISDIRRKYNIKGTCLKDWTKALCCHDCAMVQAERELKARENGAEKVVNEEPKLESMAMQPVRTLCSSGCCNGA